MIRTFHTKNYIASFWHFYVAYKNPLYICRIAGFVLVENVYTLVIHSEMLQNLPYFRNMKAQDRLVLWILKNIPTLDIIVKVQTLKLLEVHNVEDLVLILINIINVSIEY